MSRLLATARTHPLRLAVGTALCVNLALGWIYVSATSGFVPHSDNHSYVAKALFIFHHLRLAPIHGRHHRRVPDAYWPPLFPIFMALLLELRRLLGVHGVNPTLWLRYCLVSFDALGNVCGVGAIARRMFGVRVAVAAACITALFLPLVFVGASLYSESLLLELELALVLAALQYRRERRLAWLLLVGVLLGLATLSRSDGIALVVPALVAAWPGGRPSLRELGRQVRGAALGVAGEVRPAALASARQLRPALMGLARRLRPVAALLVTAALVLAPWTIRNAIELHAFVPLSTSLGTTIAGEYNSAAAHTRPPGRFRVPSQLPYDRPFFKRDKGDEVALNSDLTNQGLHYLGRHPGYLATVWLSNTVRLFEFYGPGYSLVSSKLEGVPYSWTFAGDIEVYLLVVAALGGLLTAALRRAPRWPWLAPLMMYAAVVLLNTETPRFRAPLDPFLILLAAAACATAAAPPRSRPWPARWRRP